MPRLNPLLESKWLCSTSGAVGFLAVFEGADVVACSFLIIDDF
jgi:hypothetical protein